MLKEPSPKNWQTRESSSASPQEVGGEIKMLVQEHWACDGPSCHETVEHGQGWGQRYSGKQGWLIINLMDAKEYDFCSIKCAIAFLTNRAENSSAFLKECRVGG